MRDRLGQIALLLFALFAVLPMAAASTYSLAYALGLTGLLSEGFVFSGFHIRGPVASPEGAAPALRYRGQNPGRMRAGVDEPPRLCPSQGGFPADHASWP